MICHNYHLPVGEKSGPRFGKTGIHTQECFGPVVINVVSLFSLYEFLLTYIKGVTDSLGKKAILSSSLKDAFVNFGLN